MTYRIPLMRHALINEEATLDALADWLKSHPKQLSMGPLCEQFEREFAKWQGRKHAILFNSGSSANLAVFQALANGVEQRDDKVAIPALTWATSVMPVMQMGFDPIPIDINPLSLNMAWRTMPLDYDVIFLTNALGYLADIQELVKRCDELDILLIEDNCEALGTAYKGIKSGNFGKVSTFSFFVAHHMSTIEGGAVCTDDDGWADMLRMVRSNGWDRNVSPAYQKVLRTLNNVSPFEALYTFYELGYNLRPTEITGFLGLQQLKYLDKNIEHRFANYEYLYQQIVSNRDLELIDYSYLSTFSPFCFPVVCRNPIARDFYLRRLDDCGVETRPLIAGDITQQPFWRDRVTQKYDLPNTRRVSECGFYFGIYPDMTADDLHLLVTCLNPAKL